MISEFHQLSEKIGLLAELTHTLRRENAELRLRAKGLQGDHDDLKSQNAELQQRINQAHQRVAALLEKFPGLPEAPQSSQDKELA
ncbi:MAG: cell division protein ZapB [Collimonas sp.]|uniref:cell division protein ZapB n=1 Tax=Collimonas sp. TaxID=1963772 RepID=UPI003266CF7B